MKKETIVTLKEVYEEARQQEGDLPPPEPTLPEDKRLWLARMEQNRKLSPLQSLRSIDDVRKVCVHMLADEEPPLIIDYLYYPYERVDVVGSGRFYYPMGPVECRVDVLDKLLAHLPAGEMMCTSSNDKSARLEILRQLITLLG